MVVHAMFGMQYRKKRDNESLMAPNRYFPRYVILGKPRYEIPCDGEKGFSIHQWLCLLEKKVEDLLIPQERDLKTGHVFDGPLGS